MFFCIIAQAAEGGKPPVGIGFLEKKGNGFLRSLRLVEMTVGGDERTVGVLAIGDDRVARGLGRWDGL